jgi:cobaltochelatase CobS
MAKKEIDSMGHRRLQCQICGGWFHQIHIHAARQHKVTAAEYQEKYGGPLTSEYARSQMANGQKKRFAVTKGETTEETTTSPEKAIEDLHFGVATLPIQEPSEEEKPLVPAHDPNYCYEDDALESLAVGIQDRDNVLMVGPTGCGKTSLVEQLAALLAQPVRRANLNGEIRVANFTGEVNLAVDPASGQTITEWHDGILPDAMRKGYWLLLDELDAAPPHVLFTLQAVLEGKPLILVDNHGEIVQAHPDFRVVATANTLGKGDDSGLYAGTHQLNEAFLDRFGMILEFSYLPSKDEIEVLISKTGITKTVAAKMVEVANKVRFGAANDECFCTFSTRRLLNWAIKTKRFNVVKAYNLTVKSHLSKDDATYVSDIAVRVFGSTYWTNKEVVR